MEDASSLVPCEGHSHAGPCHSPVSLTKDIPQPSWPPLLDSRQKAASLLCRQHLGQTSRLVTGPSPAWEYYLGDSDRPWIPWACFRALVTPGSPEPSLVLTHCKEEGGKIFC